MSLDITPEFTAALELMEDSSQHAFITGKAGTGKSTLLQHFRKHSKKSLAVLAPTGVAALNVQGQTIHSFFKFRPDTKPETVTALKVAPAQAKLYKQLDTIVIDEVSMLRADLLDCIDRFLRKHGPKPGQFFGGIQMLFFGDLYQLPPVLTSQERPHFLHIYAGPHFFNAKVINEIALYMVELTTVYRQHEETFIKVLNAIRTNTASAEHLSLLNAQQQLEAMEPGSITLTTTNDLADTVNQMHLHALSGDNFTWKATSTGTFNDRDVPTPAELCLKKGAQVMLLTNDPRGRWVNGSVGTVEGLYEEKDSLTPTIDIKLSTGGTIQVNPFTWELFQHTFNSSSNQVESKVTGTYTQYPLRLAWAVTIHKSQGKTFDRVIIDLGRGTFSPGQLYVALSRCRTLDGLTLRQPIQARHIMSDKAIVTFLDSFKDGYRKTGQDSLGLEWLE